MDAASTLQLEAKSPTLEELEGIAWPEDSLDSYVTRTCAALRRKPLDRLSNEELRLGLEQQVSIIYLVPIALDRLSDEPLLEASLYPGDLLRSLLSVPWGYWQAHPDERLRATNLAETAFRLAEHWPPECSDITLPGLREEHGRFSGLVEARPWLRPDEGRAPPRSNIGVATP